ncbi:hypothetical protein SAMN05446935_8011 [Burkholderia sp. YR290]|nr:hypothetical protein SAMN05446935_8011 [Burkholderia sp. YR290]
MERPAADATGELQLLEIGLGTGAAHSARTDDVDLFVMLGAPTRSAWCRCAYPGGPCPRRAGTSIVVTARRR